MSTMLDFFKVCRPVTAEFAYRSPYLYAGYTYNLGHIRMVSYGEVVARYRGEPLPKHILTFLQENDEVIVLANIVKNFIVQIILRGITEKGFGIFSPTIVPFYGMGRISPDFTYGTPVVLVEGMLDHESMRRFTPNVMAVLTASLSTFQVSVLTTLTNRVVLCLDNDEAGINGTKRATFKLRENRIHYDVIRLPKSMKDPGELLEAEMTMDTLKSNYGESIIKSQLLQYGVSVLR